MKKADIILITTCCNHIHIFDLIESVKKGNRFLNVCVIIVNQYSQHIPNIDSTEFTKFIVIEHNTNVNTSVARNIGIDYLHHKNYKSYFVSFPDDDSTFDENFFRRIKFYLKSGIDENLIFDIRCTGTTNLYRKITLNNKTKLSAKNFGIVGAVNMLLNFKTFHNTGYFDKRFGVNAKYGAGEDGDYFIRALKVESFYYDNNLYNYHPAGLTKFKRLSYVQKRRKLNSYGTGVIALLCKHKMFKDAFFVSLRALGGVIYSFFRLEFFLGLAYLEAFFVRLYHLVKFQIFPIEKVD